MSSEENLKITSEGVNIYHNFELTSLEVVSKQLYKQGQCRIMRQQERQDLFNISQKYFRYVYQNQEYMKLEPVQVLKNHKSKNIYLLNQSVRQMSLYEQNMLKKSLLTSKILSKGFREFSYQVATLFMQASKFQYVMVTKMGSKYKFHSKQVYQTYFENGFHKKKVP